MRHAFLLLMTFAALGVCGCAGFVEKLFGGKLAAELHDAQGYARIADAAKS